MIITFTNISDRVSAGRVDTEITIALKPYRFPVPTAEDNTKIAWTKDRSAYQATHIVTKNSMKLEFRQITELQLPYVREFADSMAVMPPISIDTEGYSGHPAIYGECVVTSTSKSFPRIGHEIYSFSMTVELVN